MKHLLACLPLLLASACSLVPSASVTPRYGPLDVDGDVKVSSVGASASSDASTLGLGDEDVFSPRVDVSWGPADFMASTLSANYGGRGRAEGQLDLGGVIINAGDTVDTDLDLSVDQFLLTFDLIPTGLVDVGLGLGATRIDFDARIRSVTSGATVRSAEDFVVPVLALRLGTHLGPVRLNAHASGLSGSYGGVDATFLDLDFYGEYSFEEWLGFRAALVLGYRQLGLDVQYTESGSDIDADLTFSGPYFGLTAGI